MNSPAAALTWEVWRRHRKRLLAMVFVLLAFALFYPALCAHVGLKPDAPNALDDFARTFSDRPNYWASTSELHRFVMIISLLFALLGPVTCMAVSLLCVIWMFTLAQVGPKRGYSFPARLFALPISTTFLGAWLMTAGTAAVIVVHLGWTRFVHLPHIEVFGGFEQCLPWVTLLTLSQAISWGLDAFPVGRVLVGTAVFWGLGFLIGPELHSYPWLERNQSALLSVLWATGCAVAYTALSKMRHGEWRRFAWKWRLAPAMATIPRRPPAAFSSPARAQFWFEWRRQSRKVFFCAGVLAWVPVILHVVYYAVARPGPLSPDSTIGLGLYLLVVPLFIHFFQGVSPERELPSFTTTRPLTSGEMVMARLKAAAVSTLLSWAVTLPSLAVLPLLGDVPGAIDQTPFLARNLPLILQLLPIILLAAMVLTWRFVAADLWFGLCGKSRLAAVPAVKTYGVLALFGLLSWLLDNSRFERRLLQILPFLLGSLVLIKFALAQWAFRVSIRRELLSRASMWRYLLAWSVMAVALVLPTTMVFYRESWIVSATLGIILALPLARIAFSPIALSLGRHR